MVLPPHAQELAVLFARISGIVTMTGISELLSMLQAHDVTPPRFTVLKLLHANDGATVSSLAQALGLTVGSTSQLIDRLEVDGLVTRAEDRADRRVRRIYLNERGYYVIEQIKNMRLRKMERELSKLPLAVNMQLVAALEAALPFLTKEED
jgi:DNA-binding MarR family transcriptional regulator